MYLVEGGERAFACHGGLPSRRGMEGMGRHNLSGVARIWLTRGEGEGLSSLAVCLQGIVVVKERVGTVASR